MQWLGRAVAACAVAALAFGTLGCGLILGIEDLTSEAGTKEGWSERFGTTNVQTATQLALAGDAVVLTGAFSDTIDFGGGALPNPGGMRAFVAGFAAADGAHRWSKSFGDAGATPAASSQIAADGADVLIAGGFQGSLGFGTQVINTTTLDIYAARLGADGTPIWQASFGSSTSEQAFGVAAQGGGALITGAYDSSLSFGAGSVTTLGGTDIFVAELDAGTMIPGLLRSFGGTGNDAGLLIAASDTRIALVGNADTSFVFNGTSIAAGYFAASLDRAGTPLWVVGFGKPTDHVSGVALGPDDTVIVAGDFTDQMTFGTAFVSAGQSDVFVVKLDANGGSVWGKQFGGAGNDTCWGLDVDGAGVVALTGDFTGSITFGGDVLSGSADSDAFVAILTAAGDPAASAAFGAVGPQSGRAVRLDGAGNLFVAGQFGGSIDFGHGVLESEGIEDLFLAKLGLTSL